MELESTIITSFQYLAFISYCVIFSFLLAWYERKLVARMQNRVGPPMFQPIYDFLKLSAKEDIYNNKTDKLVVKYTPLVQLLLILIMAFFIPIFSSESLLHFEGDIFFFLCLSALSSAMIFVIANISKSPYTHIGGNRSILTEISLEIPLIISIGGLAIYAKSLEISSISKFFIGKIVNPKSNTDLVFIPIFLILFIIIVISILGVLELNPFSSAKAETEIVSGWKTELTGKNLAVIELSEHLKLFIFSAFIASLFLGSSFYDLNLDPNYNLFVSFIINLLVFTIKVLIICFIILFISVASSRSRINNITEVFWSLLLISTVCVTGILILEVI